MLTPSVGRGSVGEQLAVAIFCLGLILGGVISAVMAWILGGLFSPVPVPLAAALVASAAVGGLLRDWHVVKVALPENHRQIPRSIFARGMVRASFRFGVELGTGWLTYLTSTLPYVLVSAVVLLHLPFHLAICAGVGFGVGRAAMTLLRLLDPDGEAWDRRMAEAAGWVVPACALLGVPSAVLVVLLRAL
jgi:hypothetical protein